MSTRGLSPWWMTRFILVALAGCSGGSAGGTDADEEGANDSSGISDAELFDAGSADTEDFQPPPVPPPHCGDGVLDPDEECDDGNRLDGDDCDWLCRRGPGEPVNDTPDPSVGDLERDLSWTSAGPTLPEGQFLSLQPPSLVWTGSAYATVWTGNLEASDVLDPGCAHFRLFDREGRAVVPDWTYNYPDRMFDSVDIAWSGRFFGLVWCAGGGEGAVLSGMILDAVGKPLIGPFTILEDRDCFSAQVGWDGAAFNAVWHSDGRVGFARFDELGSVLVVRMPIYESPEYVNVETRSASSPVSTVSAVTESDADEAYGRDDLLLRWLVTKPDATPLRLPAELGFLDEPLTAIAWGERHYGIVFNAANGGAPDLHLALLDATGFLLGPPRRICECDVGGPVRLCQCRGRWSLALAWGAGGWAVAYADGYGNLYLVRTDADGTFIGRAALEHPRSSEFHGIAIAFDGEGFGILAHVAHRELLFTRYVVVP